MTLCCITFSVHLKNKFRLQFWKNENWIFLKLFLKSKRKMREKNICTGNLDKRKKSYSTSLCIELSAAKLNLPIEFEISRKIRTEAKTNFPGSY